MKTKKQPATKEKKPQPNPMAITIHVVDRLIVIRQALDGFMTLLSADDDLHAGIYELLYPQITELGEIVDRLPGYGRREREGEQ